MSFVVDFIEDELGLSLGAFGDIVRTVWDEITMPMLEGVFGLFGIEDETIIQVERISSPIFGDNTDDAYKAAIIRAIFGKIKTDTSYFPNYMREVYQVKGMVTAYYKYAKSGQYTHGLPNMEISGTIADYAAIGTALDTDLGTTNTVLTVNTQYPRPELYFKHAMQSTDSYIPSTNLLTYNDPYGTSWSDWTWDSIVYNEGPDNYTITISRDAAEATFRIYGPDQIEEGETASFIVTCNRTVPAGKTVDIDFVYGGTGVDGVDYTAVASATMLASTNEVTVDIATIETGTAGKTFSITIDAIDNTSGAFELVTIGAMDTASCTITDDDTLKLLVQDVVVNEANTTISVDVKLTSAASGAFDVDYNFTDITTTGGTDYDNTTGTLNFTGSAGEVQTISIDIYADVADDDFETFEVFLENSTDVDSIDIGDVGTIKIVDGTDEPGAGTTSLEVEITKASYAEERSLVVTYHLSSDPATNWFYWIYEFSAGTYSGLNPEWSVISDMEMLPVAILRRNKVSVDDIGNPEYQSCKNLIRRLKYNVDDFIESIEANPDADMATAVDDAWLNFSMNPLDTNQVLSKMLWLSFYEIIVVNSIISNNNEYKATFEEGDVKNAIVWSDHTHTTDNVGTVATVGEYIHSITDTTLTIQHQTASGLYDEIVISTMNSMTSIDYDTYHEIVVNVLGDDNFTIPVSWFVFNQLNAPEQLEVFQYLFRFDITAIVVTELDWYQTPAFFDLFGFILIIVVTIFTLGTATSFIVAIVDLAINYAIGELIIWVAEETGSAELAAVVGIVAAIAWNDTSVFTNGSLFDANKLVDLATEYADDLFQSYAQLDSMLGKQEFQKLTEEAKAKLEEEKANRRNGNNEDDGTTAIDPKYLAWLRSVDTGQNQAIQAQYDYDTLYNYDTIVGNYVNQELQIGVN